jgi:FkbM family methyltransferase
MNASEVLHKILYALERPSSIQALLTWPKFSLESYLVVSRLKSQGISPRTVIDVGANLGQFAVAAAKTWPTATVHSFEPDPDVAAKLVQILGRLPNTVVHACAIGEATAQVQFHVNTRAQASSILPQSLKRQHIFPNEKVARTISVQMKRLNEAVLPHQLNAPVLLKIDTQGYEDRVLIGAAELLDKVEYILVEASMASLYDGEMNFTQILQLLGDLGFEFLRPMSWHLAPESGEVIEMDLLFSNMRNLSNLATPVTNGQQKAKQ